MTKHKERKTIADNPEQAINNELAKKRKEALLPFEVARAEFTVWYNQNVSTGVIPWTEPAVSWMFAAWVAGQSPRLWLTEEQKQAAAKRSEAIEKRRQTKAEREAKEKANGK